MGERTEMEGGREATRDEEKTSVPQMFIRIFITLELQRESLSDSYCVCVCVCVAFVCGVISTGGVPLPPRGRAMPVWIWDAMILVFLVCLWKITGKIFLEF